MEDNSSVRPDEEVAAAIAAILNGSVNLPDGMTQAEAVSTALTRLPDAPPKQVADAVARMVVGTHHIPFSGVI